MRHPPLINLGYYSRVSAVRLVLDRFLGQRSPAAGIARQIVTLGAGFDTLPLRLAAAQRTDVRVVELDFPSVLVAKLRVLAHVPALRSLLPNVDSEAASRGFVNTATYAAVGTDLENSDRTAAALQSLNVDFSLPTLIFSEVGLLFSRLFSAFFKKSVSCTIALTFQKISSVV